MSRIGKLPIEIPDKVEVTIDGNTVTVKGALGALTRTLRPEVEIVRDGNVIHIKIKKDDRASRSFHGLSRTLVYNMIKGVSEGFTKNLEMIGVGYKGQVQGTKLVLSLGYSHPIEVDPPEGVKINVENNTKIAITGPDKEIVGNLAAYIRSKRPPEPYKGKGVKYAGEHIRRKAGKAGK